MDDAMLKVLNHENYYPCGYITLNTQIKMPRSISTKFCNKRERGREKTKKEELE
jgi:hypothetical protein